MPRSARRSLGGYCYHVVNRGNARRTVFRKPGDYDAFLTAARDANQRLAMPVLAGCLMPNHFHLVLWPQQDGDLSRWMQWLMTAHVRRYHQHYKSSGHIWQGRFKAFAIQEDDHLLTVMRYVERNPVRARLCRAAEAWRAGSAAWRCDPSQGLPLAEPPVPLPADWRQRVNEAETDAEIVALRRSVERGRPFGSDVWTTATAAVLGVSLKDRGRPKK